MRKSRNDGLDTMNLGDIDYHEKCWEEFISLTKQERKNLIQIATLYNQKRLLLSLLT